MKNIITKIFFVLLIFTSLLSLSACKNENNHAHSFDNKLIKCDYLANSATCDKKAEYFYSCKCGEKSSKVFEYGKSLGHSFLNYIYNNDATCETNGTKTAICERENCNSTNTQTAMNTTLEHEFISYELYSSATCLENESQIAICNRDNCNEVNIIEIENTATGCDWDEWFSPGVGKHERVCKNNPLHKMGGNCSGGTATCKSKAICTDCLNEYGELRNYHLFSHKWTNNESHHWKDSICECEIKDQYEEHILDEGSGFCKKCDYMIQPSSGIIYKLSTNGEYAEVERFEGSSYKINIADTFLGVPVKTICANAFNQANISSIIIPNTIEIIEERAFYKCNSLSEVIFQENSNLMQIGTECFYGCYGLTDFYIPNKVTNINSHAFAYCQNLTTIIVPNSVTNIGFGAFERCIRTTSITVPFIGGSIDKSYNESHFSSHFTYIFGGIYYTDNLVLPMALKEVIITGGTEVVDNAFRTCYLLTNIQLPNTIKYIGQWAFYGCEDLTKITFNGTKEEWNDIQKSSNWNQSSNPIYATRIIKCLDGDINL